LYPAESAAHINSVQKQSAPGALSGPPGDVGPFALSDSRYPDAAQVLRQRTGVQEDALRPSAEDALRRRAGLSDSRYPDASEVLRQRAGVGYMPAGPPEGGTGPQAEPHTDPACGCIGDDPSIGFSGVANSDTTTD